MRQRAIGGSQPHHHQQQQHGTPSPSTPRGSSSSSGTGGGLNKRRRAVISGQQQQQQHLVASSSWEITHAVVEEPLSRIKSPISSSSGGGGGGGGGHSSMTYQRATHPQHQQQQQHPFYDQDSYRSDTMTAARSTNTRRLLSSPYFSSPSATTPGTTKPRLEDFHTLYRTAHHVPDNRYKEYLLRGQQTAGRGRDDDDAYYFNKTCCAQTCVGFSVIAILFLLFVGILLDTQPLYIKGSLPYQRLQGDDGMSQPVTQYLIPSATTGGERLLAARTAYRAAFAYLATIAVCLYMLYPGWFQSQIYRRQQRYQNIPDHDSTIPVFHNVLDDHEQHLHGGGGGDSSLESSSRPIINPYTPGWWNRFTAWLKLWLARRGWYSADLHHKLHRKHMPKTI